MKIESKLVILAFLLVLLVLLPCFHTKSVVPLKKKGHHDKEKKSQATIDKEVLFEDTDYDEDEDVMDLSPQEQKERLTKLVNKKIDANHDGFVDREELGVWCIKAYDSFEIDDLTEDFPVIDKDGDNRISWSEHLQDAHGENFKDGDAFTDKDGESPEIQQRQYELEKKLFTVADVNMDKVLDLEEFFIFKHPRNNELAKQVVIEDKLEALDKDNDGAISLEEFFEIVEESDKEMEKERFEDDLDLDEDGFLKDGELVNWVDPGNKEEADEEADHLIEECDKNADHKLSVEEIINNHELWVDSDATDYGRHLMKEHDEF